MQQTERDQLSERVIGAAIEVHRHLGPGLLESAYEECLCFELNERGIAYDRQVPLPVVFKGHRLTSLWALRALRWIFFASCNTARPRTATAE